LDVCDQALRQAAQAVIESFRTLTGDALDRHEVEETVVALARRVYAGVVNPLDQPSPDPEEDRRVRSVLGRRVLELMRAAVIAEWQRAAPASAQEMLAVLSSIEREREAIEPDWSEQFVSRLSAPGALELVVEVAHDLRSPMTSVLFLAETLQRGQSGPVNDVQHRQLGLIYGAALGLSAVSSDMIELARGGDSLVDHPSPFSVTEILESVNDIVHPMAEEKGLSIRLEPPPSEKRLGYPLALSRVLLNLTTNALKFTDEGSVAITCQPQGREQVEFAVQDTGRGIAPEALETLYQPFRRAAARRGGYCFSGTGLGLAICRRLVDAMGGSLEVETAPDRGTRFHFTLTLPPATEL
jgi:signal transduction histidine kinase